MPPTPLERGRLRGRFRFAYDRQEPRRAAGADARGSPICAAASTAAAVGPEYRVAELTCGDGGTTYVLLGERDLLAIHRDRDIAALARLSR